MCGIAGLFRASGGVANEDMERMGGALAHRGPDDRGVWIAAGGVAGLAHRRLSVIDLSSLGHQPMTSADRRHWLVYNGELYNFRELRASLESLGHKFLSRTDSEVVLHAYMEWGAACLARFDGIFAFGLWDEEARTLFAARDRLGVKPLYYWRGPNGMFAFASELKALMLAPGFRKEIDLDSLRWYLKLRRVPAPRSILRGCATLPPGTSLTWSAKSGTPSVERYWEPARLARNASLNHDHRAREEEIERLMRDAVKRQLVSDVPIGAFLSGGLDSTMVVSLMAQAGADVRTFTVGFVDQFDEAPYARRVASLLGTRHEEMYVSSAEMQKCIPDLSMIYDEPLADSSVIPTLWLSRMTRRHVTVALSGDGGDELFGGYGWYRTLLAMRPVVEIPVGLRRRFADLADRLPWGTAQKAIHMLDFEDLEGLVDNLNGCWRERELRRLMPETNPPRASNMLEPHRENGIGYLDRLLLHDLSTYLPDELLVKVDRASMSVGLETRVPLLDHRVVECALSLPAAMKIRGKQQKIVLRRILRRLLPDAPIDREKRGFGAPMNVWLRGDLRPLLDHYLDESRVRRQALFEPRVVREAVGQFLEGRSNHYRVWALIVFEMWAERYGIC